MLRHTRPHIIGTGIIVSFFIWLFIPLTTFAFSISPVKQTLILDPGQQETVRIEVTNNSSASTTVVSDVDAFQVDPMDGHALFGADDVAREWVTPEQASYALAAGEKRVLSFLVHVPESAQPGSHYLGLFAGEEPREGNIGVGSRVGSLFFLHVSGTVTELVSKTLFDSAHTVFMQAPIVFFLQLHNDGAMHVTPRGTIIVKHMDGHEVARLPVNETERKLLPDGEWKDGWEIPALGWRDMGRLSAQLVVQYGETNQRIVDTIYMWYLPWWVLCIGVGIILLIVGGIFLVVFKKKRHVEI